MAKVYILKEKILKFNKFHYIYNGFEPVAQIKNQPPWVSIGNFLRADKTDSKVHLDWTLYGGNETYRILRTVNDFTFSNPSVIQELTNKTYDDDVLFDGNNYAYKIYKNVPTEVLYYYHTDHLMTPLYLTDESQSIVWQAEYYPFGKIYSESGSVENNLRFPGQYAEEVLNHQSVYYNLKRWYLPTLGRYNSVDKAFEYSLRNDEKISHPYSYALNSPIVRIDPFGLYVVDKSCCNFKPSVEEASKKACSKRTIQKLPKKWRECVERKCEKIKIKCGGWYCEKSGAAGWAIPVIGNTIHVCESANTNTCDLANTILHEILHKCWATDSGTKNNAKNIADSVIPSQPPCP